MNRFQFAALALSLGVLCSAGVPLAAQPADPMDIDIAPPPGAGGTRDGSGDQFDFENSGPRETPQAPQDAGPGFDGLETRERPELPVEMDSQPRRQSASTGGSSNPLVRQIEEELIRIDLDLRELESDIRMYRGLRESSRNGSDAQALERTLFDYEAQRRGLIAQKRKLSEARQKAGASGPGSPDPSFAARTFEEEQENRLREGFDGNPLSPESHVANAARDAARTRDVVRDNEIQKFIEGIKDEELKERVAELNEAARMDPTLTKPFEDLLAAIAKVGADKAKPADVADALKRMEDEAKRKGLESTQLATLFMAKAGVDSIPMEEYAKYVKVIEDFDKQNSQATKKFAPAVAAALAKAREDYASYKNAEAGFLQDQTKSGLREQAEVKFQTHLQSLKKFLKLLDEVTQGGANPDGIYAKADNGSTANAPVLPQRNGTADLAIPVPDASTESTSTAQAPAAPSSTTPTATEPSPAAKANPEGLSKVASALKAFNDAAAQKLSEVAERVLKAWTADRSWYSGWFGTTDPREKELTDLSKFYFAWDSTDQTGNVFNIWPAQLGNLRSEAAAAGFDIDKEPSLAAEASKARDSVLGSMLLARLLRNYNGHLKTIQDAAFQESLKKLFIVRDPSPTHFDLKEFRDSVAKDAPTIRLKIEGLWTNQSLSEARALLTAAIGKDGADQGKLDDLKVQFHWYQQRMSRGYQTAAGGYGYWMGVTDSNVYRLVEIINHYLDKKMYFQARVALDELK